MLDRTSEEYKKVEKLYKSGKISEEDYKRLLEALERYDEPEEGEIDPEDIEEPEEERAERHVGKMLKELGIKVAGKFRSGFEKANDAAEKMSDNIRDSLHNAMQNLADALSDVEYDEDDDDDDYDDDDDDLGESEDDGVNIFESLTNAFKIKDMPKSDPGRTPENYDLPYDKLFIKVDYLGAKNADITVSTKKKEALAKRCKKFMGREIYAKLCAVLDDNFVGKYEHSCGDEYLRVLIRPKK